MYDEPTAGLDPIASTVVEDLIRSLHVKDLPGGGQTGQIASYIVVTHQHSTIRRAVDRWEISSPLIPYYATYDQTRLVTYDPRYMSWNLWPTIRDKLIDK